MTPERTIIEAAHALASVLPSSTVDAIASAIVAGSESLRAEVSRRVPHYQHRELAFAFIERWRRDAPSVDSQAVSIALRSSALATQTHRDSQSVELVWTGPELEDAPFRRTEQAILQLLDAAKSRVTLVSYAVYRIPNIGRALIRAAQRGVRLTVIVETPDKIEGEGEYSTLRALGDEVAMCSTVYFWPKENRAVGDNNKPGILHVKCAVADAEWLFLSSANLTQQAFTINMELGVLIRGGTLPARVERQFEQLIAQRELVVV